MIKLDPLNREVLRAELIRDEGLRLKTYRCTAGKLSIGVGRNLDDVGLRPEERALLKITMDSVKTKGINRDQAMALLDSDIDACLDQIERKLPWAAKLDEVRLRVIVNMCFNMGIRTLLTFKNTLRQIETGQYAKAADNMLMSLWARQVGNRAIRLANLMRLGPLK